MAQDHAKKPTLADLEREAQLLVLAVKGLALNEGGDAEELSRKSLSSYYERFVKMLAAYMAAKQPPKS